MILVNDLRPGVSFLDPANNNIYTVLDVTANKTARAVMVYKFKVKNLRTGAITELSYNAGNKVEPIYLDKREMVYLYDDGDFIVFMDNETFDQINVEKNRLTWELNFMMPNQGVTMTFYNKEIMGIELPIKVELEITECEPAVRGDTVNKATKDATLETGFRLKVPLFIGQGERIIVRTDTGEYQSRA